MNKTMKIALAGLALASLPLLDAAAADGAVATGPYVKAEVGVSFGRDFGFSAADMGQSLDKNVPTAPVAGIGVGWQFTPYLRADITLSHRFGQDFDDVDAVQNLGYSADVSSLRGFVNAYVDVAGLTGGLGAFRPYVGAGVGFARNRIGDVTVTDLTAPAGFNRFTLEGDHQTKFAWQLMAGTGIAVTSNLIADVGYRYVDAGRVRTGTVVSGNGGSFAVERRTGDIRSHEIVMGLRYQF